LLPPPKDKKLWQNIYKADSWNWKILFSFLE
jgi:hypothetical protein